ncbi:MAG: hypothetical protein CVV49_00660 [Spirochaetae bacterium HGW-Spirochaetae-5]|nr:MAG: hypothetical protein CVV49_00660 [Spirochaetae bacterium HGW-Spirochaetae-5]
MFQSITDKFNPGTLLMTRAVNDRVADDSQFAKFVLRSIKRHLKCDWGELCQEDKDLNDLSLSSEDPGRLFSAYEFNGKEDRIYIITEWDRSYTTILYPNEY